MLQRNTSGYPLQLPTFDPPVRLEPGEDINHDQRLAGCTPVDELDTGALAEPDTEAVTSGDAGEQPRDTTSGNTASEPSTSADGVERGIAQPAPIPTLPTPAFDHVEEA